MGGDLARGVRHVHHLGRGSPVLPAELAVAQPEVERGARDDDEVGLAERDRPGPGDQQLVPGGQDAASLPVGHHRQPELLGGRPGGLVGAVQPHVRAQDQHRPARLRQQARDRGDRARVGLVSAVRPRLRPVRAAHPRLGPVCAEDGASCRLARLVRSPAALTGISLRGAAGRAGRAEQRLGTHVEEHRATVPGRGEPERLVHRRADPGGFMLGPGALGDGPDQRRVVDLLQAARAPPVVRSAPAQHHHGRAVEVRRGHRAHAVGHPGPGREHREAGGQREPGGGLGREHRGLLVPHVHDPHRRVRRDRPVVEREHVPAGQREHGLHPVPLRRRDRVRTAVRRLPARPGRGLRAVRGPVPPVLDHAADVTS